MSKIYVFFKLIFTMANKRLLWPTDGLFLFQMASEEGGGSSHGLPKSEPNFRILKPTLNNKFGISILQLAFFISLLGSTLTLSGNAQILQILQCFVYFVEWQKLLQKRRRWRNYDRKGENMIFCLFCRVAKNYDEGGGICMPIMRYVGYI